MRLLELYDVTGQRAWRLHPRLSVVRADPTTRAEILAGIERLLRGGEAPAVGVADVHGVVLDLDGPTAIMLALDGAVDPIVRARELPTRIPTSEHRAALRAEREIEQLLSRRSEAERFLVEAVRRREMLIAQLNAVTAGPEDVRAAREDAWRSVESARREMERLHDEALALAESRHKAESELARITGHDGPTLSEAQTLGMRIAELESEREEVLAQLADATSEYARLTTGPSEVVIDLDGDDEPDDGFLGGGGSHDGNDPWATESAANNLAARSVDPLLETKLEQMHDELTSLDEQIEHAHREARASQSQIDVLRGAIEAARVAPIEEFGGRQRVATDSVDRTVAPLPTPAPARPASEARPQRSSTPDPEALDLADQLIELEARRRHLASQAISGHGVDARAEAIARLERARAELAEAERTSHRAMVDPEARRQIEALHEEVLAAQDRADRRLVGGKAKSQLVELRAKEEALLATFGLASFSDYLLTSSTMGRPDPAAELRYAIARSEVADAERGLAHAEAGAGPDPELLEIEDQQAYLHRQALDLLGGDPGIDLVSALRDYRAPLPGADADAAGFEPADSFAPADDAATTHWAVDEIEASDIEASDIEASNAEAESRRVSLLAELGDQLGEAEERLGAAIVDEQRLHERRREATDALIVLEEAHRAAVAAAVAAAATPAPKPAAVVAAEAEQARADEARRNQRAASAGTTLALIDSLRTSLTAIDRELSALRGQHQATQSQAQEATRVLALAQASLTEIANRSNELEQRRTCVLDELARAEEALASAEHRLALEQPQLESVRAELAAAQSTEASARLDLAQLESEIEALSSIPEPTPLEPADVEAIEFFVLSRLASQRSIAYVGSVPAIFDDTFVDLPSQDIVQLLSRLDRMTESIQVIYFTEDP
ncbi:MAG: hypothetical protein AB7V43_20000, partial [Acidimicrobiia bacterium]